MFSFPKIFLKVHVLEMSRHVNIPVFGRFLIFMTYKRFVASCLVCFLMNAAREWRSIEGGVFSRGQPFFKCLAEGAAFNRGRLSEGGVH